jgi:hypothetical protein
MDLILRYYLFSSIAITDFDNTYNLTTQSTDGILIVHWFSIATSTHLYKFEYMFKSYLYCEILQNLLRLLFIYR